MSKKIFFILFISNLSFSQNAILDTNTILIGEQVKFTITNPVKNTKIWPNYKSSLIEGIEIIQSSNIDTINNVIRQYFIITSWDTGSYYIPSISFSQKNKTKELLLNVKTIILEEGAELKDIKQPINEPIGWSDIWPWLAGFLILSLTVYFIKKYIFSEKEKKEEIKPIIIIPPHRSALKQLEELESKKIWQEGNVKEYHSKLSEIIRRYTENRFKFIALELTTDEILTKLKSTLSIELLNNMRMLLQRADLAKFAKSKPDENENIESMVLAKEFVNATKQVKDDA